MTWKTAGLRPALHGVYPILDTASFARAGFDPVLAAEVWLDAGVSILQYRHKSFWSRDTVLQARQIGELCRETGALFVINDRADYASLLNAGLHVGQDDLSPQDVRRVVPPASIVGFSTHNTDQMRAAQNEPIDYVAFGPVFPTASKERPDPVAGIETLQAVRTLTTMPLVAIGGITLDNAAACFEAGADSVAVIAGLIPEPCTKQTLRARMTDWLQLSGMLHR